MKIRIARHTNNLKLISNFYRNILSLQTLGEFQDHDGYNGIFLGRIDQNWELEFTTSDISADHYFDEDDLLVFYVSKIELNAFQKKIHEYNIPVITPKNPYWNNMGIHIKDPDGYGIIVALETKEPIS